MLVMIGAAIQLLSPGVAAIADGLLARESASQPLTHIEATTTARCPVVHAPDCGVCRFLSSAASAPRMPADVLFAAADIAPTCTDAGAPASVIATLPNERAPPVL